MAASSIKSVQLVNIYKKSSGTPNIMVFRLNSDSRGQLKRTQPSRNKPTKRLFFLALGVINHPLIAWGKERKVRSRIAQDANPT
jgi:hypothetical protein